MEKSHVPRSGWFTPHRGLNVLGIIGMTIVGVAFAAVFALLFGFLVMVLWNWLMPALFGLKAITYWQAFGIVVLAKLLFAGFAPHRKDRANHFHPGFFDRRYDYGKNAEKKEDEAMNKGWKYYKQYWREEGKAAFEDYLRRIKEQKEEES